MTTDGFGYALPTGDYAIEGFVFLLKGVDGQCAIMPKRVVGLPVQPHAKNWITLEVAVSGRGLHNEQFHGEVALDGPASVLSCLVGDIERLKAENNAALDFPSAQIIEFQQPHFQCSISRDRYSLTKWSMHCRCGSPTWWNGDSPPTPRECEHGRFAGALSVLMSFDPDCLETVRSEIASFLLWLDREAAGDASSRGDV